jgi:hypothetical protein
MKIPSLTDITSKAESALKRFPITILWAVLGTIYCIYIINDSSRDLFRNNTNITLTLALGISWLIGIQFFIEQFKNKKKWVWLKIVVLVLLGIFYWYYPSVSYYGENPIYSIRFFLFIIAGHLFVLFAPFVIKWDKNAYWNYLNLTGVAITRSLFFSMILYLGLVLALLAIEALFDVNIRSKRYGQLFIFCLGIMNTWIYLADFPKNIFSNTTIYFNKAIEVLIKYILIPLVLLYLIILYAYSAKIVLLWELPKGWVSYLVIALSALGFTIQVIINPVQKTIKSWTINRFYPWFYILLIPLNILLFVAIFRRINDYGITENRYFVLDIALWNIAMITYLLVSKKKALKVIPISLFAIAILSSFGFWGAYSVSNFSQTKRFKNIYTAVKENNNVATNNELNELKSILKFLEKRNKESNLNEVTNLKLESYREEPNNDYSKTYLDDYKIWKLLAIEVDSTTIAKIGEKTKYYYRSNYNNHTFSTSIKEYDYFTSINYYNTNKTFDTDEYTISLDMEAITMSITPKNDSLYTIAIPLREKLIQLSETTDNLNNLDEDNFILIVNDPKIDIKIILAELTFNINYNKTIDFHNFKGFIFTKEN